MKAGERINGSDTENKQRWKEVSKKNRKNEHVINRKR